MGPMIVAVTYLARPDRPSTPTLPVHSPGGLVFEPFEAPVLDEDMTEPACANYRSV